MERAREENGCPVNNECQIYTTLEKQETVNLFEKQMSEWKSQDVYSLKGNRIGVEPDKRTFSLEIIKKKNSPRTLAKLNYPPKKNPQRIIQSELLVILKLRNCLKENKAGLQHLSLDGVNYWADGWNHPT